MRGETGNDGASDARRGHARTSPTLVVFVLLCATSFARADGGGSNWFLVKITAGSSGASNVVVRMTITGNFAGGPHILGTGHGVREPSGLARGSISTSNLGGGDGRVTTTKDLGGSSYLRGVKMP